VISRTGLLAILVVVLVTIVAPVAAHATTSSPAPTPTSSPSPSPSPSAALPRPTKGKPLRIWFGGDSLAGAPGIAFVTLARGTRVMRARSEYRVSSRIVESHNYDWPARMRQVMRTQRPRAVVFMMGGNEGGYSVVVNGRYLDFWRSGWRTYYRSRVRLMLNIMRKGGARRVYWVGMPMMGPQAYSGANAQMRRINAIVRQELKRHPGARYIDAWSILARRGRYVSGWRAGDGIHLSPSGGRRLAGAVLKAVKKDWLPAK
jgi:hypothetical protein